MVSAVIVIRCRCQRVPIYLSIGIRVLYRPLPIFYSHLYLAPFRVARFYERKPLSMIAERGLCLPLGENILSRFLTAHKAFKPPLVLLPKLLEKLMLPRVVPPIHLPKAINHHVRVPHRALDAFVP